MIIHKPVREEELLKSGDRYSTIGGYTGVLTVNVPSKLRPGGRKRVNELRLGGRMSPSNSVRWDAIHR